VLLTGCFAQFAKADETPTCNVYVFAIDSHDCVAINVKCIFERQGTTERFNLSCIGRLIDRYFRELLETVKVNTIENGADYKKRDNEFKNFILRIVLGHSSGYIYSFSANTDQNLSHRLMGYLAGSG